MTTESQPSVPDRCEAQVLLAKHALRAKAKPRPRPIAHGHQSNQPGRALLGSVVSTIKSNPVATCGAAFAVLTIMGPGLAFRTASRAASLYFFANKVSKSLR